MPPEDVVALRRAGFVHDLGRLGISNAIWEKPAPLTQAELERVRLHPYLTDRMLAGLPALARVRRLAARNRERLDGSGYPSGLAAPDLSPADRVLAAADVYHAMTEPRAHRSAPPAATAVAELRNEAKAGRLNGDAVDAVLRAAGHRAPARREWPARLTAREVEVLGLLARGHPNREIARRLVVTPRTVATHIEHIYAKLDVSSPCRRDAVRDQARARRQLRTRLSRHRARSAERRCNAATVAIHCADAHHPRNSRDISVLEPYSTLPATSRNAAPLSGQTSSCATSRFTLVARTSPRSRRAPGSSACSGNEAATSGRNPERSRKR